LDKGDIDDNESSI